MTDLEVAAVVAIDRARGIGKDGDLPWRLRGDMAHFRAVTLGAPEGKRNAVVMGRRTFESIPERFRPLPGRRNFVLSRDRDYSPGGAERVGSLDEAIRLADEADDVADLFVIGGSSVYGAALDDPRCRTLHVTRVDAELGCDTFFPAFEAAFERVEQSAPQQEGELRYVFEVHRRRPSKG